jgi:hypothetical protein
MQGIDSPTWAEQEQLRIRLYDLTGQWAEWEREGVADPAVALAVMIGPSMDDLNAATQEAIEPLVRWIQNEGHRAATLRLQAQPYLAAGQRIMDQAHAAERRQRALLATLTMALRRMPTGSVHCDDGTMAHLRTVRHVLPAPGRTFADLPDEWCKIERTPLKRDILRAAKNGEPIPEAVQVVEDRTAIVRSPATVTVHGSVDEEPVDYVVRG